MQITTKRTGSQLTASLSGELDHHSAAQVREILDGALTLDIRALSLDLSGITFMDSSGIGVILGRYRIMRERGGTLRVSAMSSYAARILKMAGILPLIGQQEGQRDGKGGRNMLENRMELRFASISQNEALARTVAAAFATQLNPTIEELTDIRTAVSEAVTNAIIHGYENRRDETVTLKGEIEGERLVFIIEDQGKGIEDVEMARQPFSPPSRIWNAAAWGFP